MRAGVLVTHPGRQHSHQAALALHRADLLAGYWAGVPSLSRHARLFPRYLWRRLVRYEPVDLPDDRARWIAWVPALRRLAESALPAPLATRLDFEACRAFDRWTSRRLARTGFDAVIACEISALETFRAAKRAGRRALLDAPSLHHSAQDRLHGFRESAALHRRIVRVKDDEVALADHILTVSELARGTYLEAGVPPERVHAVPLGADLDLFRCTDSTRAPGPFRFLFVGAAIERKGFDLLVQAVAEVLTTGGEVELRVVGPPGDLSSRVAALPARRVSIAGPMTQGALAREYAEADVLVLPSRNDSFGMVVAEALASACPVIVSDQVGAKDLVRPGQNGWIVTAGDSRSLAARMLACASDRAAVRALRPACRESARGVTWDAYHARFAALVGRLLAEGKA